MSRILLAAHPTAGHTNALRAIGARLIAQGHRVAMAIAVAKLPFARYWPEPVRFAAALPQRIANDGIEILPLRVALGSLWHGAKLPRAKGYDEMALALKVFAAGMKKQAMTIAERAKTWNADVIVADYLMPAATLAARLGERPCAAIYHSALPFPTEGAPPFGSDLGDAPPDSPEWRRAEATLLRLSAYFDDRVTAAARALGLSFRAKDFLTSPISEDLNILTTIPEVEPGLLPLDGPVAMTGPCLSKAGAADLDHPAMKVPRDDKKRVYVSLGTVFNDKPLVFETILNALAALNVQTIVSAGACYERLAGRQNPDTRIFQNVPQVALLSTADVVVTHGGNNTVQETLAAGRPMVVVPFGGDQLVNARRVERLGVGAAIYPRDLTPDAVRQATEKALRPDAVARAAALGDILKNYDGAALAAQAILKLAERALSKL